MKKSTSIVDSVATAQRILEIRGTTRIPTNTTSGLRGYDTRHRSTSIYGAPWSLRDLGGSGSFRDCGWFDDDEQHDDGDRVPGLPLVGLVFGGSISLLLWSALGWSAWAVLLR